MYCVYLMYKVKKKVKVKREDCSDATKEEKAAAKLMMSREKLKKNKIYSSPGSTKASNKPAVRHTASLFFSSSPLKDAVSRGTFLIN